MDVHLVPYYSMALALLMAARSAAPTSSQTGDSSDTNGQRLFRMLSSKLHNQCLQMDTFACLGLKVLFTTARHVDSPVIGEVSDQRALEKEADVDKILTNNVVHYISSNMRQSRDEKEVKKKEKDKEEDDNAEVSEEEDGIEKRVEDFARGSFFTRKMLFPLLIGVVLKFASLIPLVLGKMTLLGTMSFLSSKLALLIIILMNLKKWFSGGVESGGHSQEHSFLDVPQFYPHHDFEGRHPHYHPSPDYADYQQAPHPIHPAHPLHPVHPVPHSGMGIGLPYHRKAFVVRGRQIGDDDFWNSGNNRSEKSDRHLKDMIWFRKENDTTDRTVNVAHLISDYYGGTGDERRDKINEDRNNSSNIALRTEIYFPENEEMEVNNEWKPVENGKTVDGTSSNVERITGSRHLDRKYIWKPSEQLNNTEDPPNISSLSARRAEYILRSRQLRYKHGDNSSLPLDVNQTEESSNPKLGGKKSTYNNYQVKSSDSRNKGNKFHKLDSYDERKNHDISIDGENISLHAGVLPSDDKNIRVTKVSGGHEVNKSPQDYLHSGSETDTKYIPTTEKYNTIISDGNLEEFDADTIPHYPTSTDITLNDEEHYGEEIPDGFDMETEHNNGNNEPFISSLGTSRGYLSEVDSEGRNSIRRLDAAAGEHVDMHEIRRTNKP